MTTRRHKTNDNLKASPKAVPVSVITGFLGAGKTSLIRHILSQGKGRFALLINEFGEQGVDGELLREEGTSNCPIEGMIELNNGCICCTVADDFLPAMRQLRETSPPFDHVLVETSGLALPGPLVDAFRWPEIRGYFRMDSLIGVIDAEALSELPAPLANPSPPPLNGKNGKDGKDKISNGKDGLSQNNRAENHTLDIADLLAEQIHSCDLIALNKIDRVTPAQHQELIGKIYQMSHRAKILPCTQGRLPLSVLLGHNPENSPPEKNPPEKNPEDSPADSPAHHHHEHDHDEHHHDDFFSFVLSPPIFADDTQATKKLAEAARIDGVLRIKGHVSIRDKDMPLVMQAVGHRCAVHYARRHEGALNLVVIATRGCDEAAIRRIFDPALS